MPCTILIKTDHMLVYLQVVWDKSRFLGCGFSREGATYVVCQYWPPGNYAGANAKHVHPLKPGYDPVQLVNDLLRPPKTN